MNLFLIATLLGAPQQPAAVVPLLQIVTVQVVASSDPTNRRCRVMLANVHSSPAVAWVLEQRSRESKVIHGASWDFLRVDNRQIGAKRQFDVETSCEEAAHTFEVVGVIYADGTYAGSPDRLNSGVLKRRRDEAAGLRQVGELLIEAHEKPRNEGTPAAQLNECIEAMPASIDSAAKATAKMKLGNLTRRDTELASNYTALKALVLKELIAEIALLESFTLVR